MTNRKPFNAKDDSTWIAFPEQIVEVLDDPGVDGSDPVVLVLDRKRAGALALMALCQRDVLLALSSVMGGLDKVGIEGNPITAIRKLGVDMADALGWETHADASTVVELVP
jgi:hypothetical protein